MKTRLINILILLLPLSVNSQTWKVFGLDTVSYECNTYSHITVYDDVPWCGLSELAGTTFNTVETPSLLFACDLSKSDHKGNMWFVGSIRPDVWTTHGNAYTVYKFDGSDWFDFSPPKSYGYNGCNSIAFQKDGKIWFTTSDSGAFMYDGANWKQVMKKSVFEGANSMAIDNDENKWFATQEGLIKFDGNNWTVFNSGNSGLKFNEVNDLAIDGNGNIWLATGSPDDIGNSLNGRIVRFDEANWFYYKTFDDTQGLNFVNTIAIDTFGKIWAGTFMGLSSFDGSNWKNYTYPKFPSENLQVLSIDFDNNGSKWLGSACGVWQFQDNTASIANSQAKKNIIIFPNPADSYVNINLPDQIRTGEISITDVKGSLVLKTKIVSEKEQLDISNIQHGAYFIYINTESYRIIEKLIKD